MFEKLKRETLKTKVIQLLIKKSNFKSIFSHSLKKKKKEKIIKLFRMNNYFNLFI